MAVANVLEEYLVALGFKIDGPSWKTFEGGVLKSTLILERLGLTAVASATAIGIAVDLVARKYENLYYASQRTGATVTGLQSFAFAAQQIGLSSEGAKSAVEGFAQAIRQNPGLEGLLKNMGVQGTRPIEQMISLVQKLKDTYGQSGYFVASQIASMYHIDDQTLQQMWNNPGILEQGMEAHRKRLSEAGIDAEDAAKKFTEFGRAMNTLEDSLGVFRDRVATDLVGPAKAGVEALTGLVGSMVSLEMAMAGYLKAKPSPSEQKQKAWYSTALGMGMMGMGAGLKYLSPAMGAGLTHYGAGMIDGGAWGGAAPPPKGAATAQTKEGVVAKLMAMGWSRENAVGMAANLYLESDRTFSPSVMGDHGTALGIAQWHKGRQDDFALWAGHSMANSTLDEQLEFMNYELTHGKEQAAGGALRGARTARASAYVTSKDYERPLRAEEDAMGRAGLADKWFQQGLGSNSTVNINQTNNINVSGTKGDPMAAAAATADAISYKSQWMRTMTRGTVVR